MVVARGQKEGTLYMTTNNRNAIAVAGEKEDSNLWHQRLEHMSQKEMTVMASKGKLSNLKSVDIDFCKDCIFGSSSKDDRKLKSEKLELVHTDVWGDLH
ncbi:uncharacterized protein LOC114266527 [Camellia sinensis]|uniref:uncharacterized protein LOC114266527 n=1 Tax=Camellia sinensis TaxID=4442 RepID=UPI0010358F96|nr:uncharacterized protein LOC114266527 [Camellia sinensis]